MSSAYNGLPGNESRKATLTVSGATNATPIQITTTAAHGLATGERVWIYGIQGNNAANGVFYVSVTGPTTFTLYSGFTAGAPSGAVAGSGAYVAAGARVCAPLTWTASSTLPDDGDPVNASSINTPLEGNFDREAWLLGRVGYLATTQVLDLDVIAVPFVAGGIVNSGAAGVWGATVALAAGTPAHVIPGDKIDINATLNAEITSGATPVALRLSIDLVDYAGGVLATLTGPDAVVPPLGLGNPRGIGLKFTGVVGTAYGCSFNVNVQAYSVAGLQTVQLYGSYGITARITRPIQ